MASCRVRRHRQPTNEGGDRGQLYLMVEVFDTGDLSHCSQATKLQNAGTYVLPVEDGRAAEMALMRGKINGRRE